jgi:membrane fusion protein (multidrug efflux system)
MLSLIIDLFKTNIMKRLIYLLIPAIMIASCGEKKQDPAEKLAKLKTERSDIDVQIKKLEGDKKDSVKLIPVSVTTLQPVDFHAYIEVQAQVGGDEVVTATAKMPGTIRSILAQVGQKVHQGQLLATLDATVAEQQIKALQPQLDLQKTLYEKQQKLWAQNIGTEVQLMSAKAQYEASVKQKEAMIAQRNQYSIVSPISGTIDAVNVKVGDPASPGVGGFHVINLDKLKAEANLGENYLGRVKQGDPVTLVLTGINDSINTHLNYVAQSVDPASRSFMVQVKLVNNKKLHPNMSCMMKISNYQSPHALVVPVSVIQKTSKGTTIYIADGNRAKLVSVTVGVNSNGMVEILSGLNAGDKVITTGYEEVDNGQQIVVQ